MRRGCVTVPGTDAVGAIRISRGHVLPVTRRPTSYSATSGSQLLAGTYTVTNPVNGATRAVVVAATGRISSQVNRTRPRREGSRWSRCSCASLSRSGSPAVVTGLQYARGGIEAARGETTAAFRRRARLEHLQRLAGESWPAADPCVPARRSRAMARSPTPRLPARNDDRRQPRRTCARALQARAGDGLLPARHGSGQLTRSAGWTSSRCSCPGSRHRE